MKKKNPNSIFRFRKEDKAFFKLLFYQGEQTQKKWTLRLLHVLSIMTLFVTSSAVANQKRLNRTDIFTIILTLDITAKSAQNARSQALSQAPLRGLSELFRRLVPRNAIGNLPIVDPQRIRSWVKDIEISHERFSTVRYAADFTISYIPVAVRSFLRDAQQRFAETPSPPLLILPVLEQDNQRFFWDNPNPWLSAWVTMPARNSLVTILAPLSDAKDKEEVTSYPNLIQDREYLLTIASRYGTGGAVLAVLSFTPSETEDRQKTRLQVWRIDNQTKDPELIGLWLDEMIAHNDLDAFFSGQVETVATAVEEAWKEANLNTVDDRLSYIDLIVPVDNLDSWINIGERLKQIAFARYIETLALEPKQVLLRVGFSGTIAQLKRALQQDDFQLTQESDMWILGLPNEQLDIEP